MKTSMINFIKPSESSKFDHSAKQNDYQTDNQRSYVRSRNIEE